MSNLTGQQINLTYPGLLNLANATTGITNSLQAIQDGLGNNTGIRITEDQLEVPNIGSFVPLPARYYGSGFLANNAQQYALSTQGVIQAIPFMDKGLYSYSAITFLTFTTTTTSDTFEAALYSTQMINPYGLFPHQQIISGITADTTTTGQKTYVFPSDISFSGYGGGIFFLVYKVSNSGVQPTWRGGGGHNIATLSNLSQQIYGISQSLTTNSLNNFIVRTNNSTSNNMVFTGLTTFDTTYSNTIDTLQSTSTNTTGIAPGFILHTKGY